MRGAYVLRDPEGGRVDAVLIATGSEVSVALAAQTQLAERGIGARVVSMPSWEIFERQEQAYRDEVLPPAVRARLSVEAGITLGWQRWTGADGDAVGIDGRFGASAPGKVVLENLGFTADNVARRALALVERLESVRA
jgi:transketolase